MVQAGSQPLVVAALGTEWIRDWGSGPHRDAFIGFMEWYAPEVAKFRKGLRTRPAEIDLV